MRTSRSAAANAHARDSRGLFIISHCFNRDSSVFKTGKVHTCRGASEAVAACMQMCYFAERAACVLSITCYFGGGARNSWPNVMGSDVWRKVKAESEWHCATIISIQPERAGLKHRQIDHLEEVKASVE